MMIVKLSRRNILSLLHKLEMENSAQTIVKPGGIAVVVEPDEVHYADREEGPGPMHPETEQFIRDMQDALLIVREHQQAVKRCTCGSDGACSNCPRKA